MLSFFKQNPVKRLKTKRSKLLAQTVNVQRSGDLKAYAKMMEEVDHLDKQIEAQSN